MIPSTTPRIPYQRAPSSPPPIRNTKGKKRSRTANSEVKDSEVDEFLASVLTLPVGPSEPISPRKSDSLEDYRDGPGPNSRTPRQQGSGSRNTRTSQDRRERFHDDKSGLHRKNPGDSASHVAPLGPRDFNHPDAPSMNRRTSSSRKVDSRSGEMHENAPKSRLKYLDGSSTRYLGRNLEAVKMAIDSMEVDPAGQDIRSTSGFWGDIAMQMGNALDNAGLSQQMDVCYSP